MYIRSGLAREAEEEGRVGTLISDIVSSLLFNMDSKNSKLEPSPAVEKDVALGDVRDIGANLYVEADQLSAEELESEGAKVLRILDWRIMPIVSRDSRLTISFACPFSDLAPALHYLCDTISGYDEFELLSLFGIWD